MDTLIVERQKAEFDVRFMKLIFWGGDRGFEMAHRMALLAAGDPIFGRDDLVTMSQEKLIVSALKKAARVRKLTCDQNLSDREAFMLRLFVDERSYADLHWNMFVPALEGQATAEQMGKWLPLARSMNIIGCYAQTELGHGSNVRGIETTATFDPLTDEFILESPTITSTKWWPGGLGKVATHALVQARLIISEKDYGIHAFIVQVRDLENHFPLPGITVGYIGAKYGNNTVDNGFLAFDHVRIDRKNMLMRMAEVTKDGNYVRSSVPSQILYGAMVTAREVIVSESAINLSRAVTIALRYSAVRRQFSAGKGMAEIQVLDYMTQQQRLFPLLAATYAFQLSAHWLKWLYDDVVARFKKNDFSTLPEVHSCTSSLKALTTSVTAAGIEECRKLCGGHGYLYCSGLPELYTAYLPSCTYDGENTVLFREVGHFLLKTYLSLQNGVLPAGTTAYLGRASTLTTQNCTVSEEKEFSNEVVLLDAFEARSARLVCECAKKVQNMPNFETGLNEFSAEIVGMARAHSELIVISRFYEKLQEEISGFGVKDQLQLLYHVYALSLIKVHAGEFLIVGYCTPKQVFLAKARLRALFSQIRPNAVALVDSFDHSDHFLRSTLGRYDGDVYNHLYNEAWKDPLNQSLVIDGYNEYIKPIIKQQWSSVISKL